MDYSFWFWVLVSFMVGRITVEYKRLIYIGTDITKYEEAFLGVLLRDKP